MPLPHSVLPAAAARRQDHRRARAVPRANGRGVHAARCAHRRHPRAQGARRHRKQLRRDERPVHAACLRAARACSGRGAKTKRASGARSTSTPTSSTSSTTTSACTSATRVIGQLGELRAPPACRPVHSPRASPAIASRCCCRPALEDAAQFAESLREGAEQLGAHARRSAHARVDQHRRGAARYRCRRADAFARRGRDRVQGGQGSRPQSRRDLPGGRPEHRAPLHRHQHRRAPARGDRRGPAAPRRAAHRAVHRRRSTCGRTTSCCCG